MKEILERRYKIAQQAQSEWNALLHLTKAKPDDSIILFPGTDHECNFQGMRYLDTYMQRINTKRAIILTVDSFVKNSIGNYSDNISSIIEISQEQAQGFIALYQLRIFDDRFIVVSLNQPFCRNAEGMIGIKDITVEQLVAIGVYSIIPFRPLPANKKTI